MSSDTEASAEKPKPFEWFELCIALLLGFGAVGASLAGYQAGLWNGKTTEYFTKSASLTTLAAADEHQALMTSVHDAAVDLEAKRLIAESQVAQDEKLRQNHLRLASSLYTRHISEAAYLDLGLPPGPREAKSRNTLISPEELDRSSDRDLDEKYMHQVFAAAEADRKRAQDDFAIGSHASSEGDRFALAEVLFAVSLFVSGTSLVFKTRLRWLFAAMGGVALISAASYMGRPEWM